VRTLFDSNVHVEATNLIIPGHNDGEDDLKRLCRELVDVSPDIPLHFSRFFPHYRLTDVSPTSIDSLDKAASIAKEAGVKHVYLGNVWERDTSTSCPSCGAKLLQRDGFSVSGPKFDGTCSQCGEKLYGVWK
jgi:pyruvate formate lyase activating enzyme